MHHGPSSGYKRVPQTRWPAGGPWSVDHEVLGSNNTAASEQFGERIGGLRSQ